MSGMYESVIVGATEVVAALGADQLAMVTGQSFAAGGADLAMVIDCGGSGGSTFRVALSARSN